MSTVLELKHLEAFIDHLDKLPRRVGDTRLVVNRTSYDNYKDVFKLTDNQMNSMFLVSDYIE